MNRIVSGSQLAAAGTAVSNTIVETNLGRKIFTANELIAGKIYTLYALARCTGQNSTDTVQLVVRFGSSSTTTSNTSCAASTAVDAVVGAIGVLRVILDVQTSTRLVLTAWISDVNTEGQTSKTYSEILTIAAGVAYYLDLNAIWSVANAANSIQAESFVLTETT